MVKLNNIWGYGQLFGYSGIDGANRFDNDFIGTLTQKKIGIRFEMEEWIKIHFPVTGRVKFQAVTGDMIEAVTVEGDFFLTFLNADTLVGYSPVLPKITAQNGLISREIEGCQVWSTAFDSLGFCYQKTERGYQCCFCHSRIAEESARGAQRFLVADIEGLKKERYAYFERLPKCRNKKYERLYYKALSVNKVNVHTPEGNIPCMWTTPDRKPHRQMWLWDSVFHALSIATYNGALAKDAIRAVISQIREDGFAPHMMCPTECSNLTQPQVLAWGVWEVYQKTGDRAFLEENVDKLEKYLEWDQQNRDKNGNGLLEWLTEPDNLLCKCGESGLDNSPRFDFDQEMDAVDFSVFQTHDAEYLANIYAELGETEKAKKWRAVCETLKLKINELLWDEEDGVYYDRLFDGTLSKVLTPTSFFPLFANIPSKKQAEAMVKVLTDPKLLWSETPVATIAQTHPTFSTDMWRGGVWLNINYLLVKGLKNYGYEELAKALQEKTLQTVNKWYKKTGVIFEFYDPKNEVVPYLCDRKGKNTYPPDWRRHMHSICDFNWSACFTLLFIQNELY